MAYDDSSTSFYQTTGIQTIKGDTGPQGVQGVPGVPGNTIWSGTGTPQSTLGLPGDFYIDTVGFLFYGPKTFSGWSGSGVTTRGPQGIQGVQGTQGNVGPSGPLPFQTPAVPWAASTTYTASAPASLVTYQNIVYLCTTSHVSQSTFGSAYFQPLTGAPSYDSVTLTTSAKAPTVAAGDTSTNIATTSFVSTAVSNEATRANAALFAKTGFRNRLLNGTFTVNQGVYISNTALSAAAYGHDQWKAGSSGCTYTFTQGSPTTSINITAGTLTQPIEAGAIEGGSYVLSWSGTAQARVYQGAATGSYASSPLVVTGLTANTQATVEFATGTLSLPQLETGTVPSAFEMRPFSIETLLCQRYFIQWTTTSRADLFAGLAYSTTGTVFPVLLPVPMRATPTISSSIVSVLNGSGGQVGGSSQAVSAVTDKSVEIAIGAGGLTIGQASILTIGTNAGGFLSLSARL